MKNITSTVILFLVLSLFACNNEEKINTVQSQAIKVANEPIMDKLGDYWFQGKAEVSRYELSQNRYNNIHSGDAVMVFVTEDFLTDKQVKNDNYKNPNSIQILKNNSLLKFTTGIYDYSIMSSIFTPIDTRNHPQTLKVTSSSQEWCGQTFMQINKEAKNYRVELRSYFENEGDQNFTVKDVILEEELYNRIRMNPTALPKGKMKLLPSTVITRLLHLPYEPLQAELSLEAYVGEEFVGKDLQVYQVKYADLNRTLAIVFEAIAPYHIVGWTDSYPSVFDKKVRTTIAKKTHSIMTPYWKQNSLADTKLRAELGLE